MTKGEAEAYVIIKSVLSSLIREVEEYCECYDCGSELMKECREAKQALIDAKILFDKGKKKKK